MRLLFVTGSRGEWGYIRPLLKLCKDKQIEYYICGTNMHLLPSHGMTIQEIEKDGFKVSDPIYMSLDGHSRFAMAKSLGVFQLSLIDVVMRLQPDWIILAGDRGEQLVGAIAGAYTYTPVAHIQAGELSGNIDGMTRHAIGKLVHLHFASNRDAGERLIKLGEEPFRVKIVGAPQLDELIQGNYTSFDDLRIKYELPLGNDGFILVIQHPVTEEYEKSETQIQATVAAINSFKTPKVWILPNNDAGSDPIRQGILKGRSVNTFVFKNLPRSDYLGFLRLCACIVGNSSLGIIEAPTFFIPTVNIGRRQQNRFRGSNVIDVPEFEFEKITAGIRLALSTEFKKSLNRTENPYGDGHSSERILEILEQTPKDSKLLVKQLTF